MDRVLSVREARSEKRELRSAEWDRSLNTHKNENSAKASIHSNAILSVFRFHFIYFARFFVSSPSSRSFFANNEMCAVVGLFALRRVSRVYLRPFELVLPQIKRLHDTIVRRKQNRISGDAIMIGRVRAKVQITHCTTPDGCGRKGERQKEIKYKSVALMLMGVYSLIWLGR